MPGAMATDTDSSGSTSGGPPCTLNSFPRYERPVRGQLVATNAVGRATVLHDADAPPPTDFVVGVLDLDDALLDQVEDHHARLDRRQRRLLGPLVQDAEDRQVGRSAVLQRGQDIAVIGGRVVLVEDR